MSCSRSLGRSGVRRLKKLNIEIMRTYKYIGLFRSAEGHEYTIEVDCNGYLQAMILLTADAIRSARHYQLSTITDEKGNVKHVGDILKVGDLIS